MRTISENKKAHFDFEFLENFEAGLALFGFEVKAIKTGHINLTGSHIIIRDEEALLVGASIPPYQPKNTPAGYDPQRTRKLLLRKQEIKRLVGRTQEKGLTLVPIRVYTKQSKIKLEFALARGRGKADKRQKLAKRDAQRKIELALRGKF